ncbi:globin domain-containing protein [Phenylobacterium sp.]|jgi:hemoglobin-like flavoprotein|uniref:globin domain-containing protein n=1 Tax=Phenylobacterium sp. TaxID=1871053 RepID=UPI0035B1991E
MSDAFARAADIEASLELLAERDIDPTAAVYERMFEQHPHMKPYFWRDKDWAIRGEMLSRTFAAILDFVGERRYADVMIGTEMVTHEGYDVPREVFSTFFAIVRDALRDLLGGDWTPAFESAWAELLAEIESFGQKAPQTGAISPFHAERVAKFQRGEMTD